SEVWQHQRLPTQVGWDSHNYVTMAVDRDGHLHVSGNMHVVPLIYFRTETAGDISTLKKMSMTGKDENRVTYPKFLTDHQGKLIYSYRDGSSGNGVQVWNAYDTATRAWSRFLDTPLLDGDGKRNAYPHRPQYGPDGWYHLIWVWRDTPDCATNHNLSYARSQDLKHWQSASGVAVKLPMRFKDKVLVVDPAPSGGGMINGGQGLFFDSNKRPVISYHKADENGHMQIYAARYEQGAWKHHVLTHWDKAVDFSGRGSMNFIGISLSGLRRIEPGLLTMTYRHKHYGHGRLMIDEESLKPVNKNVKMVPKFPAALKRIDSDFTGLRIRRASDIGGDPDGSVRYLLQWQSLGVNHDRRHQPPYPEPSKLKLYKLRANR
ncbi:MAG: BNR repeat-containing protein, partial [Verrucomicrobiae bacterium]|nr:BNR repeat-containing protein [Verrucomicrobiae bacterium]NNJ85946.1 hypothetical protein [Akkermansiaceae bacterium]